MVPPDSFSIEAPHSSIDFCNGCDGGTQCESFSSKVLSCADAVPRLRARPSAIKPPSFIWRVRCMMVLPAGRLLSTRLATFGLATFGLAAFRLAAFNRRKLRAYSDAAALLR